MSHATVSIVCNALQRERLRMCLVFANRYTIFSVIAQKLCGLSLAEPWPDSPRH